MEESAAVEEEEAKAAAAPADSGFPEAVDCPYQPEIIAPFPGEQAGLSAKKVNSLAILVECAKGKVF